MSETDEKVMATFEKVGGPAFPATWRLPSGGRLNSPGMTLRDWFAGQALAGIFANADISASAARCDVTTDEFRADTTKAAYATADAMLSERSKATTTEADT